jgi:hypothetical protein
MGQLDDEAKQPIEPGRADEFLDGLHVPSYAVNRRGLNLALG